MSYKSYSTDIVKVVNKTKSPVIIICHLIMKKFFLNYKNVRKILRR